jgi:hypothetical protein
MGVKHGNVELHIDQLVLYDMDAMQRQRVAAAIEQALRQMLSEHGVTQEWSAEALAIDASLIQVPAGAKAEAIGAQVAHSVYGQIAGSSVASSPVERNTNGSRADTQSALR